MGISILTAASRTLALPFRQRRLLVLAAAGCVFAVTSPSRAADPHPGPVSSAAPDGRVQARRLLLERAKQRYEAGRGGAQDARQQLEGALDALRLAYQLAPASWLFFNLAQVQSQLGACDEATLLYQKFLASKPAPEARASAEEALKLLGNCAASPELSSDENLAPGLQMPSIAARLAAVPPTALPAGSLEPTAEGSSFRGWPWIFGGLALASAVTGALFYADAVSTKHDLDQLRVGGPIVAETQQRGESAQSASRVLGGFALGFTLAAGACLWPTAPGEAPSDLSQASTRPHVLPLGAGASYSFEF